MLHLKQSIVQEKNQQEEASFSLISWFQRAARRALQQEEEPPQVYQEEDTSYAVGDKDSGYTAGDTNLIYDDESPQQPLNDTQTWNVSTEVEFGESDGGTDNATEWQCNFVCSVHNNNRRIE